MEIKINYLSQVKKAAGISKETIIINEHCSIKQLVIEYLCKKNKKLRDLLIKENGEINNVVLIFVGDEQVKANDSSKYLNAGDEITIMTPIAGG